MGFLGNSEPLQDEVSEDNVLPAFLYDLSPQSDLRNVIARERLHYFVDRRVSHRPNFPQNVNGSPNEDPEKRLKVVNSCVHNRFVSLSGIKEAPCRHKGKRALQ